MVKGDVVEPDVLEITSSFAHIDPFIIAFVEIVEVQPTEFITVKLYVVLGFNPFIVVVVPVPVNVVPPGDTVTVQVPEEGKLLKDTDAEAKVQVGCVIVLTTGALGVAGCILITALVEAVEVQPEEFVTVKV